MDDEFRAAHLALTELTSSLHDAVGQYADDQQLEFSLVHIDPVDGQATVVGTFDARSFVRDMVTLLELP